MSSAALSYLPVQRIQRPTHSEFAAALLEGLNATPKRVPSKYFYDEAGSALFDQICELPEYYPTRTETRLLRERAGEIAQFMGPDIELVEYGAGSLQKVGILLSALERPRAYLPIDISGEYLRMMAAKLTAAHPQLRVRPVVADFTKPFHLDATGAVRRIGFFPGSTIGNLDRREALTFLRRAASLLKGGGLLIGVDLVKDPAVLHAAYNDSAGVTEAFNKNILARANRELDADFDLDSFAHYAFYNPAHQRIEMHLMSLRDQRVRLCDDAAVLFAEGETIHTENSHKYTVDGFRALASEAGFIPRATWCDANRLFSLHWLEA
jgi:dimethylhistidine N-methyltransferase